MADGIQPVGNDQQSLTPAQLGDGLLDVALVVGVHAGSGLIQNDDGGILQNAAGNGDSLPLSTGEAGSTFADDRVKAVGQFHDEVIASGFPGCLIDLLPCGVCPSHGDVVIHGILE